MGPGRREDPAQDLRFEPVLPLLGDARGLYLRDPFETSAPLQTRVTLKPTFHEDAANASKVTFQMKVAIQVTAPWIFCAEHMMLMSELNLGFNVRVDPTGLPPGEHFAAPLLWLSCLDNHPFLAIGGGGILLVTTAVPAASRKRALCSAEHALQNQSFGSASRLSYYVLSAPGLAARSGDVSAAHRTRDAYWSRQHPPA